MRLFIVSNRLPISVSDSSPTLLYKQGSGGLATAMKSVISREANLEVISVGWPGEILKKFHAQVKKDLHDQYNAIPIFLTKNQLNNFYYGYCNKVLWPLFHSMTDKVKQSEDYWEEYLKVNTLYFQELSKILKDGDIVWIHDYHLMLLPGLIKKHFPNTSIGYFHHTPIPEASIFKILPEHQQKIIFDNITQADLLGFHTKTYKDNFIDIASEIYKFSSNSSQIKKIENKIDIFPISIDFEKYYNSSTQNEVKNEIKNFKKIKKNSKLILSLDRLDYTKNIPIRLKAYAELLEEQIELREKVLLIIVAEPSRTAIKEYQQVKVEVEELVEKINSRFTTKKWIPVKYINEQLNFEKVSALYYLADINLITAIRDGMNLVAKEYIAAKRDQPGGLILSKHVGAAEELSEALLIDPESIQEIKKAIQITFDTPSEIQKMKNMVMQEKIKYNDVVKWSSKFLNDLVFKEG